MKSLKTIASAIGVAVVFAGAVWAVVEVYGTLAKKDDIKVLKSGILELARCVDNPQYVRGSDRAQREPTCETRVFRALEEEGSQ